MRGPGQHVGDAAALDHAAGEHDGHVVAILGHDTEVVRDDQGRRAARAHLLLQQVEHLRLHGHIQAGGGFVGDHQLRLIDQRHGDHHPLRHAPGEFVRIGPIARPRVGYADSGQDVDGTRTCGTGIDAVVGADQAHQLVADTRYRLQRGARILRHKTDARAAHLVKRRPGKRQQIGSGKTHLAGFAGVPRQQSDARHRRHRLAGAGLADQADDAAGANVEIDAVQDTRQARLARRIARGKLDHQGADGKQRARSRRASSRRHGPQRFDT